MSTKEKLINLIMMSDPDIIVGLMLDISEYLRTVSKKNINELDETQLKVINNLIILYEVS